MPSLDQSSSIQDALVFIRRIEPLRTVSFAARRLHMSRAAFIERLHMHEAAAGGRLVREGDELTLTNRARRLLERARTSGAA